MRGLSLVLAVVGVDFGKTKAVVFAIKEKIIGSHGGISDDGETLRTSVDDTQAPLARPRSEFDDVFFV